MAPQNPGRVTPAHLSKQIDDLTNEVRELRKMLVDVAVLDTKVENIEVDVGKLETRINSWSVLNSLGVVISAIVGLFFGPRQ